MPDQKPTLEYGKAKRRRIWWVILAALLACLTFVAVLVFFWRIYVKPDWDKGIVP